MNYILQTNSLTKKYKNFQALNGLTMNVPKGSIYGFVLWWKHRPSTWI